MPNLVSESVGSVVLETLAVYLLRQDKRFRLLTIPRENISSKNSTHMPFLDGINILARAILLIFSNVINSVLICNYRGRDILLLQASFKFKSDGKCGFN